ncbi:hypothetical protein TrVFT333_005328 [Trichoderma virens FT-333]|nr:hypothetical protein TrVFT333_005328 [Trichoderma virens FT-333]
MATSSALSVPDQIRQLNDARKLVLGDVKYYPSVVRGILPIIGPKAPIELRRWVTDFLAEAFATPALPNSEKETMQPYVLTTLESLIENEVDAQVLRNVIQTAASIYPLAMRWIINNSYDTVTWERMVSIKQKILQLWDNVPPTVRICCIKFAQRVVLAQSVASGAEHRYGGGLDVSLDKVPPNHQTLDPRTLEAEASGLLDRMLSILQGNNDGLLVDATLNCLSIMVRTRPAMSSRILNALLNFNPLQAANSPLTPKTKVMIKSMEKTARLLLIHLSKRDPHNPIVPRIQQHVEGTMRMVAELFDSAGRKRPLEPRPQDGYDAKRPRIEASQIQIPPWVQAPIAWLMLDAQVLAKAVDGVRGRLETLNNSPPAELNPNTAPLGVEEDEDDYEPDFYQAEDTEQILNKLDSAPAPAVAEPIISLDDTLGLRSFSLPQPQQLTPEMALNAGNGTVTRVLDMMKSLDEPGTKKQKAGFSRLAASSESRDSWMTILTRLATRSSAGLEEISVKAEADESSRPPSLNNSIREILYNYIMEDFRKHIDVAVSWLCEEWYNDKVQQKAGGDHPLYYEKCTLRLIDGFLPYLHPQDKVLTRFLSEIPELNRAILSRVKHMCRDPSVTQLALTSLLYLVIMRPPIKEAALDTVQDIWTDYEDARTMAGKYLTKYRPLFLENATNGQGNGSPAPVPAGTAITT